MEKEKNAQKVFVAYSKRALHKEITFSLSFILLTSSSVYAPHEIEREII